MNALEIPALLSGRSRHSRKLRLLESLTYRQGQQVQTLSLSLANEHSLARTALRSAGVPACVPLPRGCFGHPLVHEVSRLNLGFAFHLWFCGYFCFPPVGSHNIPPCYAMKSSRVGSIPSGVGPGEVLLLTSCLPKAGRWLWPGQVPALDVGTHCSARRGGDLSSIGLL